MARCNLCRLYEIRRRARAKGWTVTLIFGDGVDAYVHPREVGSYHVKFYPERYPHYRATGFMALSNYCVCDD